VADLQRIGGALIEGMFVYLSADINAASKEGGKAIANPILAEGLARRNQFVEELINNKDLIQVGRQDDSGSESAPSEGCYRE